ncbi:hypothetical protein HYT25_01245 [Candidatus Pacearchaeota archaeon]|nr:hypothetical protein [Candidatus Pacearchaeota archaeon]
MARTRIAELKKKISHAQQKKNEFSNFLNELKSRYNKGEISHSFFLETFYQKRNGMNVREWIEHFEDYIQQCRKQINRERRVLLKTQFVFVFASLIFVSVLILPIFYFQPKFIGFAVQEGENISANESYSEEITGEVQNNSLPEQEPLQTSEENISIVNKTETTIPEFNITENETSQKENITEIIPEEIQNETQIEIPINETVTNITEINQTILENITFIENATIKTIQFQAVLNQNVKWRKTITSEETGILKIAIPENSKNIKINKTENEVERDVTGGTTITGGIIGSQRNFIFRFLSRILGAITGRVVDENIPTYTEVEVDINDTSVEYEIEYETPAPYSVEEDISAGKRIKVFGPDDVHYQDVLAYTNLNENLKVKNPGKIKIKWIEDNSYITPISIEDKDSNGVYDYLEWIIPSLSEQTFEIVIIAAEHLDSNRDFVADIYDYVNETDNITYTIPENEYARAYFITNLTKGDFIDIYVKSNSGTIGVYEKNSDVMVGNIEISGEGFYFTELNLSESQDTFDLKSLNGDIEYDYIHDARQLLSISLTSPTNQTSISQGGNFNYNCTVDFGTGNNAGTTLDGNWTYCVGTSCTPNIAVTTGTTDLTGDDANGQFASTAGTDENFGQIVTGNTGGTYQLRCGAQDQDGPYLVSPIFTVTVTADATKPAISIAFPTNLTNTTNNNLDVNATYSDAGGISAVWYSNDTNLINRSLGSGGTFFNITNITWSEGIHNVTVWVNDTAGNENYTTVTFMVDSILPAVEIQFPTVNNTNTTNTAQNVNFTFSDLNGIFNIWYSNDTNLINRSLGSDGTFFNITNLTWSEGKHNVTVYVNDTFGNVNQSRISFTVDTTNPDLTILIPEVNNTNTTNTAQNINFTFSDSFTQVVAAWYSNDTGTVNRSLGEGGTFFNITNITWSEGKHNVTIYANDTVGNINKTSVSFTIDTIQPTISIAFPTVNNSNGTNTLNVNFI